MASRAYIKVNCPNLSHKEKGLQKKNNNSGKAKRAYIVWEDNTTSSSTLKEDE